MRMLRLEFRLVIAIVSTYEESGGLLMTMMDGLAFFPVASMAQMAMGEGISVGVLGVIGLDC